MDEVNVNLTTVEEIYAKVKDYVTRLYYVLPDYGRDALDKSKESVRDSRTYIIPHQIPWPKGPLTVLDDTNEFFDDVLDDLSSAEGWYLGYCETGDLEAINGPKVGRFWAWAPVTVLEQWKAEFVRQNPGERLSCDAFVSLLNRHEIKKMTFAIAGYEHYRDCTIEWGEPPAGVPTDEFKEVIVCRLSENPADTICFYDDFNPYSKIFHFGHDVGQSLTTVWPRVQIKKIETFAH